ncbi:MAG: hypothetical protein RPU72_12955, partial [Candidatus Sedimenticola sp. (ex Thyasira tokunagai)]
FTTCRSPAPGGEEIRQKLCHAHRGGGAAPTKSYMQLGKEKGPQEIRLVGLFGLFFKKLTQ